MERPNLDHAAAARHAGVMPSTAIALRHLRYFLVVSEELHFRRAAERLYMAQPPLSQAIRRLEELLGVQLLTRTSRAVALTEAGRAFAEEARKVLASLDLAVAEARHAGGGGLSIQIGCTPYLPIELLVRFLDGLHELEPRLRPDVKHLVADEQVRRLRGGDLDLGIFPCAGRLDNLLIEPLFEGEPLAAFLNPDHALARKAVLGPDDLADQTLVSFWPVANPPLAARFNEQMEQVGYRFRDLHEPGIHVRDWILAVAGGVGVALLPGSARDFADASTIVIRPLDPPLRMPHTVVAWRDRQPNHLRTLTDEVRKLARAFHEKTRTNDSDGGVNA